MERPDGRRRGFPAALGNRYFRRIWLGQAVSQMGDGLASLGVLLVVNRISGSTAALAGVAIATALPQLLFGLLAGVLVDRWNHRRVLIASDLVRALLVVGLLLVRERSQLWVVYVLSFAQAAVGTFFTPAMGAYVPSLVEPDVLLAANTLSHATRVVATVAGAAVAGVLVGAVGSGAPAFALDGASFLISALLIASVPARGSARTPTVTEAGSVLRDLVDGLTLVARSRILAGTMLTFTVTMLGLGALEVLFVPFITRVLNAPTSSVGLVQGTQIAGMIAGSALVGSLTRFAGRGRLVGSAVGLMGIVIAGAGAVSSLPALLLLTFGAGLCVAPINAVGSTTIQRVVPAPKLGRATGALGTLVTLASVISMALAGALGDALGVRAVFYLAGAITFLSGLLGFWALNEPASGSGTAQPDCGAPLP